MWRKVRAISLFLFIPAVAAAGGRDLRSGVRPVEATVDSSGRVIPTVRKALEIERLTESGVKTGGCGAPALPLDEARALVEKIAKQEDFYPDFVVAVARAESGFKSDVVSPKGALGLMQLLPETAKRYGVEICDPAGNVLGGVRFLQDLHGRYHNPLFILAAYNAGETALAEHGGVPPFPETVKFVADVINDFYGWETVVKSHGSRSSPVAANGGQRGAAESRRREGKTPDDRWASGFVWNVE